MKIKIQKSNKAFITKKTIEDYLKITKENRQNVKFNKLVRHDSLIVRPLIILRQFYIL